MKRRKFMQSSLLAASTLAVGKSFSEKNQNPEDQKALIELREYEMHFGGSENDLHNYFQNALMPALNKLGVKNVGVFKELSKSEPAKVYLLIAYPSWNDFMTSNAKLKTDDAYKSAAATYMKLTADKFPYTRYRTKLMIAFDGLPQIAVPKNTPRIFELRTYEGYNEDALARKIKMFNKEEFTIFYRTKLTPVFFGEVIAGHDMPCLTYMITFANMEEHDKNWAEFGKIPDWKKVSSDPNMPTPFRESPKYF